MPDIREIEILRQNLLLELTANPSPRLSIKKLNLFFNLLLESDKPTLVEAYSIEFIENYLMNWKEYDPAGINPSFSWELIQNCKELMNKGLFPNYQNKLKEIVYSVEEKTISLEKILGGKTNHSESKKQATFPVLESNSDEEIISGYLEKVNITINRNKETEENIFIIIPGGRDLEKKLENQIRTAWNYAVEYVRRIVKIEKINFYKVIIELGRRNADYIGSSLGITLTLRFIEEILKFHNSKKIIIAKGEIAFSGTIDKKGKIEKLSPEIINDKIETVFYSDKNIFVIPPSETTLINNKLKKLQKIYPNRNLEILNLDSISEIINRRNLSEIQRLPFVKLAKNYVSKNLLTFGIILSFAAAIILAAIFIREIDTNPFEFQNIENNLNVLNHHGKILWNKNLGYNPQKAGVKVTQKLIDIDEDGINEVLLAMLESKTQDARQKNMIALYNNTGDIIWGYSFNQDVIPNDFEDYSYTFDTFLLGITSEENRKVIYCFADNNPSFPSIIFKLDLHTGEEIGERFWHPGHLSGGLIYDFNKDGVEELVVWGINNGLQRTVMFSIDPQKLVGKAPTINRYDFYGIEPADFNFYILLPKTDYDDYKHNRFNHIPRGSMVRLTDHTIYFPLLSSFTPDPTQSIAMRVDYKSGVIIPEIGDEFQEMRDKLVKSGELNYPLTNTPEFKEGLVKQLKFWNGKEFVNKLPGWNKK